MIKVNECSQWGQSQSAPAKTYKKNCKPAKRTEQDRTESNSKYRSVQLKTDPPLEEYKRTMFDDESTNRTRAMEQWQKAV